VASLNGPDCWVRSPMSWRQSRLRWKRGAVAWPMGHRLSTLGKLWPEWSRRWHCIWNTFHLTGILLTGLSSDKVLLWSHFNWKHFTIKSLQLKSNYLKVFTIVSSVFNCYFILKRYNKIQFIWNHFALMAFHLNSFYFNVSAVASTVFKCNFI